MGADPLGLISGGGGVDPTRFGIKPRPQSGEQAGGTFKDALMQSLDDANKAQQEATRAVEDLAGGQGDLENVILATNKADNAFRMLQALRNRVIEAYDEIKQMRV